MTMCFSSNRQHKSTHTWWSLPSWRRALLLPPDRRTAHILVPLSTLISPRPTTHLPEVRLGKAASHPAGRASPQPVSVFPTHLPLCSGHLAHESGPRRLHTPWKVRASSFPRRTHAENMAALPALAPRQPQVISQAVLETFRCPPGQHFGVV